MKPLEDHTILFDDECPMCSHYTKAFVKTGMLDGNGREAFTEAFTRSMPDVDWDRARNEIALINKKDNTVQYGVDGIVTILGNNAAWVKFLYSFRPIKFMIRKLYFFISYNRKVIAPGSVFEGQNTCTPDMKYGYRWAYILFAWLMTSVTLVYYSALLVPIVPQTNFAREFMICGGQVVFQGAIVWFARKDRFIHYLGNMMTVSLIGALLLLPGLLLQYWIDLNILFLVYFMLVVGFMFLEHRRRVKILGVPAFLTATWVLYRIIVLFIIL